MAVGVRSQLYRLDPPPGTEPRLTQLITNIDEMFQQLYEDLYAVDQAAVAATSSSSSVTAGSPWVLVSSNSPSGVTTVDFTGLSAYTELLIIVDGMTFGVASKTQLRVSTDNGSTFKSASGDYKSMKADGTTVDTTEINFYDTNATAARKGHMRIGGINVNNVPKIATGMALWNADGESVSYINVTSPITAVRVLNSSAVNFTGGTIYVMGRV